MPRHERDAIAWCDLDCAFQPFEARFGRIVRAVALAVHGLFALIGGVEKRVAGAQARTGELRLDTQLHALALRVPEVAEVSESGLL